MGVLWDDSGSEENSAVAAPANLARIQMGVISFPAGISVGTTDSDRIRARVRDAVARVARRYGHKPM